MRFWNGFMWRNISDLEAKYREAAGQLDNQPEDTEYSGPPQQPPLEHHDETELVVTPFRVEDVPPPATPIAALPAQEPVVTPPASTPAAAPEHHDLTDEELELLTAPKSPSVEG